MDTTTCIYVFLQNPSPSSLSSASIPYPWEEDCYLVPVLEDDPLLQLDFSSSGEAAMPTSVEEAERLPETDYKEALSKTLADLLSMK